MTLIFKHLCLSRRAHSCVPSRLLKKQKQDAQIHPALLPGLGLTGASERGWTSARGEFLSEGRFGIMTDGEAPERGVAELEAPGVLGLETPFF